jgi:hypothetical protein
MFCITCDERGNPMHELHKAIGVAIAEDRLEGCTVIKDQACGGKQSIPLFCCDEKSRKTEYCDVDLLIVKDNKVRVIVEIEESNVTPIQICGKLLASALSSHFIHEKWSTPVEMGDSVLFIQVLGTSRLKLDKTSKMGQWTRIEKSIRSVLPIMGSRICCYRMFQGDTKEFAPGSEKIKALGACIQSFLAYQP